MFDSARFVGEKIEAVDLLTRHECKEIVGVYPVVVKNDDNGNQYYEISDQPEGKLLVYRKNDTIEPCGLYFSNEVESSQLVDLL